jgi:site-specific recombinase XerD
VNRYWRRKYDTLRGLYRYATSRGFVDYVPLPATVPKMPERMVPYIYSTGELQRLINPAAPEQIGFRKLQPHTFRAVLLLLYGAGLRIGEAVALTLQDVDLDAAVITIRDTKFHKTRLVPVGLKLNQAMAQYAAQRKEAGHSQNADAPFFVLRRGGALSVQIVQQAFTRLRKYAGVGRADGARYQPRLHDIQFFGPQADVLVRAGCRRAKVAASVGNLPWTREYRRNAGLPNDDPGVAARSIGAF